MSDSGRPQAYGNTPGRPTEGGVYLRKTNKGWSAYIRWQRHGERRQRVVARSKNKELARAKAEEELARMRQIWETERDDEVERIDRRWDRATEDFLDWCDLHLRPSSRQRYAEVLSNFESFAPRMLRDLSGQVVERYKVHLYKEQGREPSGVNFEVSTLKRFWNWCKQPPRKWVERDPFEGVMPLEHESADESRPRILTRNECEAFRATAPDYAVELFDFAICTGLRLGELQWLDPDDLDLDHDEFGVVTVRSKKGHRIKGHLVRDVPLSAKSWAIAGRAIDRNPSGPVFPAPRDPRKRWTKMGPCISRWMTKAGIPDASLKTCRATFASYALRHLDGDLELVREWMGHANIETTRRYLTTVPRHQRSAINGVEFP